MSRNQLRAQASHRDMDALIEELTKDNPNIEIVKQIMHKLGLNYTDDPVARMNTVLMSLHPQIRELDL